MYSVGADFVPQFATTLKGMALRKRRRGMTGRGLRRKDSQGVMCSQFTEDGSGYRLRQERLDE